SPGGRRCKRRRAPSPPRTHDGRRSAHANQSHGRPHLISKMWIWIAIAAGVLALAHTAPAPFLFDVFAGDRAAWHMPKRTPPTIYLTFDDGPNPTTTPALLDLLAAERVHATFFLIDRHITDATAALVQ